MTLSDYSLLAFHPESLQNFYHLDQYKLGSSKNPSTQDLILNLFQDLFNSINEMLKRVQHDNKIFRGSKVPFKTGLLSFFLLDKSKTSLKSHNMYDFLFSPVFKSVEKC